MAEKKIPRSRWIEEIPFDVAVWGDKDGAYQGGGEAFRSEAEFEQALRDSQKLPKWEDRVSAF